MADRMEVDWEEQQLGRSVWWVWGGVCGECVWEECVVNVGRCGSGECGEECVVNVGRRVWRSVGVENEEGKRGRE